MIVSKQGTSVKTSAAISSNPRYTSTASPNISFSGTTGIF